MRTAAIRLIQKRLADRGHYRGAIDGLRGPLTHAAVQAALQGRSGDLPAGWTRWSNKRKSIAYLQLSAHDEGIDAGAIDGWWGPQTEFAVDALEEKLETGREPFPWRDVTPIEANPNDWPQETQSALTAFYGRHGEKDGFTPPLERVACPWTLKLAWNQNVTVSAISIHERCAESLARALERVHAEYGPDELARLGLDLYGGSYNPRRKRGGSSWSTHAWAIAIDWDPSHNKLRWGADRARMAGRDYLAWWEAWEAEGWVSLGRSRNFDWMHVQAAKL